MIRRKSKIFLDTLKFDSVVVFCNKYKNRSKILQPYFRQRICIRNESVNVGWNSTHNIMQILTQVACLVILCCTSHNVLSAATNLYIKTRVQSFEVAIYFTSSTIEIVIQNGLCARAFYRRSLTCAVLTLFIHFYWHLWIENQRSCNLGLSAFEIVYKIETEEI